MRETGFLKTNAVVEAVERWPDLTEAELDQLEVIVEEAIVDALGTAAISPHVDDRNLTRAEHLALERAHALIAGTQLFDELGLAKLAGQSRIVAGDVITLIDALTAERSARRAIQDRCEELQTILSKRATS